MATFIFLIFIVFLFRLCICIGFNGKNQTSNKCGACNTFKCKQLSQRQYLAIIFEVAETLKRKENKNGYRCFTVYIYRLNGDRFKRKSLR